MVLRWAGIPYLTLQWAAGHYAAVPGMASHWHDLLRTKEACLHHVGLTDMKASFNRN